MAGEIQLNGTSFASESSGTITVNNGTLGSSVVFPAGHIIQTKQLVDTTNRSATNTSSFQSIGTELAITPSSSSNKILIMVQAMIGSAGSNFQYMSILRDTTDLTPTGVNGMILERPSSSDPSFTTRCASFSFLDSPSTTASVTYKISAKVNSGTMYIGRRSSDTNIDVPTFLTLMEIVG
jgi:hypothetical protein